MLKKFYAVRKGRTPGIYKTWTECLEQTKGFPNASYKSFVDYIDAENFLKNDLNPDTNPNTQPELYENAITAYVDGSYREKDKSISYGVVLIQPNKELETFSHRYYYHRFSSMRNVVGEVHGSLFAINRAIELGYKVIHVYYDYFGIEKWAIGEWKAKNEFTQDYAEIVNKYRKHITIYFHKVKGHTGDKYNEMADQLAGAAE